MIWSFPVFLFLLGLGLYFTVRLRFIQIRLLPRGIKETFRKSGAGEISSFQALMTALSATVGTGNIVGVAGAIVFGGPGAVFWLWIASFLMMTVKYGEALLAVKYRCHKKNGAYYGGPMYYMEYGLHRPCLAVLYSFLGLLASFGVGNMVQSNSLAAAANNLLGLPPIVCAFTVSLLAGVILMGGIKNIAGFSGKMVPFMAGLYTVAGIFCLFLQWREIPAAFLLIITSAFQGAMPICGGFAGATIASAMRFGVARGIFSNEAGLGNASIAAAAAKTDTPERQGLVSMVGTFIDSLVMCSITALVIIISGLWQEMTPGSFNGALLTANAFGFVLGEQTGKFIVNIGLILFAFSTIIGWAFYGQRYAAYLWGEKAVGPYNICAIVVSFTGALVCTENVWYLSDCLNGLMLFPNILALVLLRKVILRESRYSCNSRLKTYGKGQ